MGKGIATEVPIKIGVKETEGFKNTYSLSGLRTDEYAELRISTPFGTRTTSDYSTKNEKGLGVGGSIARTKILTIVIPNFRDTSEFLVNLFYDSEKGQSFTKDMNNDLDSFRLDVK